MSSWSHLSGPRIQRERRREGRVCDGFCGPLLTHTPALGVEVPPAGPTAWLCVPFGLPSEVGDTAYLLILRH